MALRQTYLSVKDKLPQGAEYVLVMHGRGNDEIAPPKSLLDEFNAWKAKFTPDEGHETAFHYAWDKSDYERRFRAEIAANPKLAARLQVRTLSTDRSAGLIATVPDEKPHLLIEGQSEIIS
jgi:hypothetical protein